MNSSTVVYWEINTTVQTVLPSYLHNSKHDWLDGAHVYGATSLPYKPVEFDGERRGTNFLDTRKYSHEVASSAMLRKP